MYMWYILFKLKINILNQISLDSVSIIKYNWFKLIFIGLIEVEYWLTSLFQNYKFK